MVSASKVTYSLRQGYHETSWPVAFISRPESGDSGLAVANAQLTWIGIIDVAKQIFMHGWLCDSTSLLSSNYIKNSPSASFVLQLKFVSVSVFENVLDVFVLAGKFLKQAGNSNSM